MQVLIAGSIGLVADDPQIVPEGSDASNALPVLWPSGEPSFVRIAGEAELATRIVAQVGVPALLAMRPTLSIHDGAVLVLAAEPGSDLRSLVGQVQAIPGVKSVTLAGRLSEL